MNLRTSHNEQNEKPIWVLALDCAYKVLISKEDGSILEALLVSPSAEETISVSALAIKATIPTKHLKSMMYSYPSRASE